MTTNEVPRDIKSLARVVQRRLDANRAPGGNRPHAGFLATVRSGLTPSGDLWAHQATAPFTAGLTELQARGARRAAAIRAINKDVVAFAPFEADDGKRVGHQPVGRSLANLYRAEHAAYPGGEKAPVDQIVAQVGMLSLLDLDEAALVLHGLIGRCAGAMVSVNGGQVPVTVDFNSLAWTLANWGDGISPRSVSTRTRLISDFYGYRPN